MNILVVSQYYYPEPFRINEICEMLVTRGHQVTVLTTNPSYPDGDIYEGYNNSELEEMINGVRVIRCKSKPRGHGAIDLFLSYVSFFIMASKKVWIMSEDFDCVYSYQLSPITSSVPAIIVKLRKKIPMFLYCLDIWPEAMIGSAIDRGLIYNIIDFISKKIYFSADVIGVTSPSFKQHFENKYHINGDKIKIIYQHADPIRIDADYSDVNCKATVDFFFIGNIGESQNVECIIEAFSKIENRDVARLHLVGSGSHLCRCQELIKSLSLENSIIYHGRVPKDELGKYYALADVCIVSLRDEGITGYTIPGKIQEYMSAEKAVLGCINGDAKMVIETAKCGKCVQADDSEALAIAIDEFVKNRNDIKTMGKNAKIFYINHFTKDIHVNSLESILEKLIKKGE